MYIENIDPEQEQELFDFWLNHSFSEFMEEELMGLQVEGYE